MSIKKEILPGTKIATRYEVMQKIGSGGMSNVYIAYDKHLNKKLAVKVFLHSKNSEKLTQGTLTEIDLLKNLHHSSLPQIFDFVQDQECIYILMDYVEGLTLTELVEKNGPQSVEDVYNWGIQLCDVLSYLHSHNPTIIYGDMKPQNIVLRNDGNIVLIDFGTARELRTDEVGDRVILGTRGYAAPEQYGRRGEIDPRTDIFGLGATMYTLITGRSPNEADSLYSISTFRPELKGSALEKIIAKCCSWDKESRYQSCSQLEQVLKKCQRNNPLSSSILDRNMVHNLRRMSSHFLNFTNKSQEEKQARPKYIDNEVFISYKHTDEYRRETPDTRLAEGLYKKLTVSGIKTYFSKYSIIDEGSYKFDISIVNALKESRVLVVVGTRPDYMNAPWVRKEFQQFLSKMKNSSNADEFAVFNYLGPEMHENSLPEELKNFTSYKDPEILKKVIIKRLSGSYKQLVMPIAFRAGAVWKNTIQAIS